MEILNYQDQPQGSYAIATFDIYFGPAWGMTLKNWKLCRSKNGHLFVQGPSYKKGEFEGKPQFAQLIEFNQEKGKEFTTKVLELLKPSCRA
jgi:hypothetical protein